MPTRREPLNLVDFSGGLNTRGSQFELAENESPRMENIVIDPLGGIYTRKGWECWSQGEIDDPETWDPRRGYTARLSDGTTVTYLASAGQLYVAGDDGVFEVVAAVVCEAVTHMADFVSFGDDTYIVCGRENETLRAVGSATPVTMTESGAGNWNDDYTTPVEGCFPKAELVEAHAGYAFVANTEEDGLDFPNRIRWSHPTSQGDWAADDFIDIQIGGSHITALMSYEDHLLIFKPDGIWALYGYNLESWQLVQKSATVGAPGPEAVTRNEEFVFFYSASDRGGVYAYGGERPVEISEKLRETFRQITAIDLVWVGWMARKLWVTVPWTYDGPSVDSAAVLIFDPALSEDGGWTYYTTVEGALGPLISGSNADSLVLPMGVLRNGEMTCVVRLEAFDVAADLISDVALLGVDASTTPSFNLGILITAADEDIIADGMPGFAPFQTNFTTAWQHAGWPTRKKSWRRPDFVMRRHPSDSTLSVASFRDYEEATARRRHLIEVAHGSAAVWGEFDWGDGTLWGDSLKAGATIRRGSSYGLARALQLAISGLTPGARWGIDAIILKIVMRRFR